MMFNYFIQGATKSFVYSIYKLGMDPLPNRIVCASLECSSPGIFENFKHHATHANELMTIEMLAEKLTS
jgi:hypothetical protein